MASRIAAILTVACTVLQVYVIRAFSVETMVLISGALSGGTDEGAVSYRAPVSVNFLPNFPAHSGDH